MGKTFTSEIDAVDYAASLPGEWFIVLGRGGKHQVVADRPDHRLHPEYYRIVDGVVHWVLAYYMDFPTSAN